MDAMIRVAAPSGGPEQSPRAVELRPGATGALRAASGRQAPGSFRATFSGLPFDDDSFVFDGHAAYGHRIDALVEATLESWESVRA